MNELPMNMDGCWCETGAFAGERAILFINQLFPEVEGDDVADRALADRAEGWGGVGAHAAVVDRTPDSVYLIAGTFEKTDSRGLCSNHVLPLGSEIDLGRDVLLPRLHISIIIYCLIALISILVGKSSERMAELMHHYRTE